jgi:hypothetical protein
MTNLDSVLEFLTIVANKGFLNENTVGARRTACNKLFELLESEERTVEYVLENLESLKVRFSNKYKDISGKTVEEYFRRVRAVLDDYTQWTTNRADWERSLAGKQASKAGRDEDKTPRSEKAKPIVKAAAAVIPSATPAVFPFQDGREVKIELPVGGLSMVEIKRLGFYLLPYANDWTPDVMPTL